MPHYTRCIPTYGRINSTVSVSSGAAAARAVLGNGISTGLPPLPPFRPILPPLGFPLPTIPRELIPSSPDDLYGNGLAPPSLFLPNPLTGTIPINDLKDAFGDIKDTIGLLLGIGEPFEDPYDFGYDPSDIAHQGFNPGIL
jgi:hypothetical protein